MPADADPSFEVATIKPADPNDPNDGFHLKGRHIGIENQTIDRLLMFAYADPSTKVTNMSMADFVMILEFSMDKPVVDQTGLTGKWDFAWRWTADESREQTDANAAPGMFAPLRMTI